MTEIEFQQAKRVHDRMTRPTTWERFVSWLKCARLPCPAEPTARRARLDRKAEVERKARQAL